MEETLQEEAVPCDLIADLDGEIVSMTTRSGVPKMKTGDTCQKGDLLISGIVEILNDSQEVVRTEVRFRRRRHLCPPSDPILPGIFPFLSEKNRRRQAEKQLVFSHRKLDSGRGQRVPGAAYHFRGRNPLAGHRKFCPPYFPGKNHPHALPD